MSEASFDELRDLRQKVQDAVRARERALADAEAANARLRETAKALQAEFGVESVEEARELLSSMQEDKARLLEEVRDRLKGAVG